MTDPSDEVYDHEVYERLLRIRDAYREFLAVRLRLQLTARDAAIAFRRLSVELEAHDMRSEMSAWDAVARAESEGAAVEARLREDG